MSNYKAPRKTWVTYRTPGEIRSRFNLESMLCFVVVWLKSVYPNILVPFDCTWGNMHTWINPGHRENMVGVNLIRTDSISIIKQSKQSAYMSECVYIIYNGLYCQQRRLPVWQITWFHFFVITLSTQCVADEGGLPINFIAHFNKVYNVSLRLIMRTIFHRTFNLIVVLHSSIC